MLLGEMRIGKSVEIYINRDGYNYRVVSKIEDVNETRICVSLIASTRRIFQFEDTDIVDLVYRNEDKMWKWSNVTGSVTELDGEKFHCFTSEAPGEPYNRRNAYRVTINEHIIIQHKIFEPVRPTDADGILEDCFRYQKCGVLVRDISEVGVGFFSNDYLNLQDEISFCFGSDVGEIKCTAIIIRSFESRHGNYRYYYGCRFIETSRTLTKYIYEMQRQELQKAKDQIVRK